jgi:hypothetical protein
VLHGHFAKFFATEQGLKDTRFILVRAECPYVQFAAARVVSTKKMVGSSGRERDRSRVSEGKVKVMPRVRLLLGCVCDERRIDPSG